MKVRSKTATALLVAVVWAWAGGSPFTSWPAAQKQASSLQDELIRLDEAWNKAEMSNDLATLERLLALDFVAINELGELQRRDKLLEEYRSGYLKIGAVRANDYDVRVYGDTGVMIHRGELKGTFKGKDISSTYRASHVWVKRDQRWQIVTSQTTRIAPR